MQHRMKTHQLDEKQAERLLGRAQTGSLATVNADGTPYVIPVHFLWLGGCVYIHGLPKGQKIDNIKRNAAVCMTVYEMDGLLLDGEGKPCDTNTKYQSVILSGSAELIDDLAQKKTILQAITAKYTPQLADVEIPENMAEGTAVIKMEVGSLTGKYYG